jgi:Bacteriophage Sf6, terminase small subunit-like
VGTGQRRSRLHCSLQSFTVAYNQARRIQAGRWADEIIDLSDESRRAAGDMALMQSYKLSVDSRKWLAARLLPDAYGDRVLVNRQPRSEIHIFLPMKDPLPLLEGQATAVEDDQPTAESSLGTDNDQLVHPSKS